MSDTELPREDYPALYEVRGPTTDKAEFTVPTYSGSEDRMTTVDLRKLRRPIYDVNMRPFSEWCWEGMCKDFPSNECDVPCECEHHTERRP